MALAAAAAATEPEPEAAEVAAEAEAREVAVLVEATLPEVAVPRGQAAASGHMAGHMAAAVWAWGHVQVKV